MKALQKLAGLILLAAIMSAPVDALAGKKSNKGNSSRAQSGKVNKSKRPKQSGKKATKDQNSNNERVQPAVSTIGEVSEETKRQVDNANSGEKVDNLTVKRGEHVVFQ